MKINIIKDTVTTKTLQQFCEINDLEIDVIGHLDWPPETRWEANIYGSNFPNVAPTIEEAIGRLAFNVSEKIISIFKHGLVVFPKLLPYTHSPDTVPVSIIVLNVKEA